MCELGRHVSELGSNSPNFIKLSHDSCHDVRIACLDLGRSKF